MPYTLTSAPKSATTGDCGCDTSVPECLEQLCNNSIDLTFSQGATESFDLQFIANIQEISKITLPNLITVKGTKNCVRTAATAKILCLDKECGIFDDVFPLTLASATATTVTTTAALPFSQSYDYSAASSGGVTFPGCESQASVSPKIAEVLPTAAISIRGSVTTRFCAETIYTPLKSTAGSSIVFLLGSAAASVADRTYVGDVISSSVHGLTNSVVKRVSYDQTKKVYFLELETAPTKTYESAADCPQASIAPKCLSDIIKVSTLADRFKVSFDLSKAPCGELEQVGCSPCTYQYKVGFYTIWAEYVETATNDLKRYVIAQGCLNGIPTACAV